MSLPNEVNPQLLASSAGYTIDQSLRLRSSASAMFYRTYSTPTDSRLFTWSCWIKRGNLTADNTIFGSSDDNASSGNFAGCRFTNSFLQFFSYSSGYDFFINTSQVFRDPADWYHVIVACDSTQATASNRIKIYINGTQITAFSSASYPALNHLFYNNRAQNNFHGCYHNDSSGVMSPFDGYFAELNFVDGQQLTPSSLGQTDSSTGVWVPKKYTGTYGNNGFYMKFSDTSSTTNLVKDFSGRGNNMIPNNLSLTADTTYDAMKESPTLGATASNYCTLNPLALGSDLSQGNLRKSGSVRTSLGTMILQNGKYYFEITIQDSNGNGGVGVKQSTAFPLQNYDTSKGATYFANGEYKIEGATQTSGFSSYTNGDVLGIAVDTTQSPAKIWFAKNNTWQGTGNPSTAGYSLTSGFEYYPVFLHGSGSSSTTGSVNFGQRPFAYTPPTGYKELNTFNLPTPTIAQGNKHFDAKTWSGNSSTQSIPLEFAPDLIWNKSRNAGSGHSWWDVLRGTGAQLSSQETAAETTGHNAITSFSSNAISLGVDNTGTYNGRTNETGRTYVGWVWNAGDSTVTNTSGSISAQVRANPTAGFSIVTYTGTGSNATVGHGLGAEPQFIIVKNRTDGTPNWYCYSKYLDATSPQNYTLYLSLTNARDSATAFWNNTAPTPSVFTVGTSSGVNGSTNAMVAYCFTPIAGYSAFGSYTGNGSTDGPFIYLGFRPRFVIIKGSDYSGADWTMYDSARNTYNALTSELVPNNATSENNYSGAARMDFVSNGIKLRTAGAGVNASGYTYIYMAFAENPFKYANAR